MTVTIHVGYNLRTWTTFEVRDATPEEIEILNGDEEEALALCAELDEADRLIEQGTDHDDNPEIFTEAVDASLIEVSVDGDDDD